MKSKHSLTQTLLCAALALSLGPVVAAEPARTPAPMVKKHVEIRHVDAGARSTAPRAALSPAEHARVDSELKSARQRLEKAAREVADLSMKLGENEGFRYAFKTGEAPQIMSSDRPVLGVVLDERHSVSKTRKGPAGSEKDAHNETTVVIRAVTPGGPAEQAGIRAGDRLIKVNGKRIGAPGAGADGITGSLDAIGTLKEGQKVPVLIERDGSERTFSVTARKMAANSISLWSGEPGFEWNNESGMEGDFDIETLVGDLEHAEILTDDIRGDDGGGVAERRIVILGDEGSGGPGVAPRARTMVFRSGGLGGLQLAPLNPALGRYFGTRSGVLVVDNRGKGFAGLQAGDVITRVDGANVENHRDLTRALMKLEKGSQAKLDIMRDRKAMAVSVDAPSLRDLLVAPLPPPPPLPPVPPLPRILRAPTAPTAPAPPPAPPAPRGVSA